MQRNSKGQFVKGSSGFTGKHNEDTKNKMSIAAKKRKPNFLGKHHSNTTKIKIRQTLINKGIIPKTVFKKGHITWNKGLHQKNIQKGNHWNWRGGITPINAQIRNSIEFSLWREAVFARDNWTCQKTGIKGGQLISHHIFNFAQYPELRFAIDNGITLSKKSHQEFHKKYGIKNNIKKQLKEFLGF